MKSVLTKLIAGIALLVVVLVLGRNFIFKFAVEQGVTRVTGFPTSVKAITFDFPSTLQIQDLVIKNPEGFEQKIFVNIPEIYVSLVLPELLSGKKIHLTEVRLNIQEVGIEKNSKGVSNIQLLSSVGQKPGQTAEKPSSPTPSKSEKKPAMPFLLEKLVLTIRQVSFQDNSSILGKSPVNKLSTDLNVDKEVFANIDDPMTLVNLIVLKVVKGVTWGNLLNINPEKLLGDNAAAVLGSGKKLLEQNAALLNEQADKLAGQAGALLEKTGVSGTANQALGGAQDALSNTSDAVEKKVSGLLAKLKK